MPGTWYAAQTQSDAVVSLGPLGIELRAQDDLWLLGAVVAASAACFLASSGFLYVSQNTLLEIGEESLGRRLPDPRTKEASWIFLESGLTKVNRGCRYGASSMVTLLSAVTPMVGGIVAGAALLVIVPLLTSTLAIAATLWSMLLYPLMRRQVRFADRLVREKTTVTGRHDQWQHHLAVALP